ncbi:uncharacterized protein [Dendrobates tinctorius]|uniref:uncharacterized protein isoform X2 n=1 Tax=Dendrobates tinctorius TaxID=92724 RepID=UPI003CC95BF3
MTSCTLPWLGLGATAAPGFSSIFFPFTEVSLLWAGTATGTAPCPALFFTPAAGLPGSARVPAPSDEETRKRRGKKDAPMMQRVVGIFSREGDSSFSFLSDALMAEDSVRKVRSYTITNDGLCKFSEEVSRCDCAILYHSKNRGRVNITNVTDSLYDEEITDLSRQLGKENVIVVADDLDSSSSEMRVKILQGQPLIEQMATGLFLISREDKNSPELLKEKLQKITSCFSRKASKNIGKNQSVLTVVDLVQLIFFVPGQVVTVVMSVVLFYYNTVIFWVMMPVRVIYLAYKESIQGVMMPVRVIYLVYKELIQGAMMVRRIIPSLLDAITRAPRTPRNA